MCADGFPAKMIMASFPIQTGEVFNQHHPCAKIMNTQTRGIAMIPVKIIPKPARAKLYRIHLISKLTRSIKHKTEAVLWLRNLNSTYERNAFDKPMNYEKQWLPCITTRCNKPFAVLQKLSHPGYMLKIADNIP